MTPTILARTGLLGLALLAGAAAPAAAQSGLSQAQRQAARACMPDIRSYCANVERGGGRILACLQQNSERLSSACRQAMSGVQR